MVPAPLTAEQLSRAFAALDDELDLHVELVVGGGTAMMLAYHLPVRTTDVDAYPVGIAFDVIADRIRAVARRLGLPGDWINPHFETFAHVLPDDYGHRLRSIFQGRHLHARALGVEDLL